MSLVAWTLMVVLAALLIWVGWGVRARSSERQHLTKTHLPVALEATSVGDFPPSHHLEDVPWHCTRETYGEANALQMIALQKGRAASRDEVNFLMGATYGAVAMPGREVGFSPFTNPEPGHAVAAPYLGLVRHFYTTDDPKLYLRALRFHLFRGHPLRIPLDGSVLYGRKGFLPHSDLLVGYDERGFFYYTTVALEGTPLEPGVRAPGEQGRWMSDETLLEAVESLSTGFRYPWRYAFTLFEPWPEQSDFKPVWRRNSKLLMGGQKGGPRQGAAAIAQTAERLRKKWRSLGAAQVKQFLSAAYTRQDNADFLRARFAGNDGLMRSANLLEQAGQNYQSVGQAIQKGIRSQAQANQVAAWLDEAAAAEWEVGSIFARVATSAVQPMVHASDIGEPAQP